MQKFTDKKGKTWTFELNIFMARKIRTMLDLDLINIVSVDDKKRPSMPVIERLSSDPFLLVDLLFVLCSEEAQRENISDEDFASRFDGDLIATATDAVLDEIVNFSQPAKRKVLARILKEARSFAEKMEKKTDQILKSPELTNEIQSSLSELYTESPESSE